MRQPYTNPEFCFNEAGGDGELETVHVYVVRGELSPVVDAEPETEQEKPQPKRNPFGIAYCSFIGVFFTLFPLVAILAANLLPPYDAVLSKTLTLTLSLHPTSHQAQLYQLPEIKKSDQVTVPATGSSHIPASQAYGLLTFYNGLFSSQTVPAGATLKGKDGVAVVTSQSAVIPAATPTTPPTYGTVSVTAVSIVSGTLGNIPASDIDQACCGPSILAQNLYAFSGGRNAQDVMVVQKSDISQAAAALKTTLDQQVNDQAQQEQQAGQQLVPLSCAANSSSNHNEGDQAQSVAVSVSEQCLPLAYTLASVQQQATAMMRSFIPRSSTVIRFSLLLLSASNTQNGVETLTIRVIAFLVTIRNRGNSYRPIGR